MDLYTLLIHNAEAGLERLDEHMPAGHNGPYHDLETPVRNTSHWAITFLNAFRTTGDEQYLDGVETCLSYLLSTEARPHGETFRHRAIEGIDACNGLIGQAWTIEALATVGGELNRKEPIETARSVFLRHPFTDSLGAWKVVEVDGSVLGYDLTLNHQLWFAAAGAQIVANADDTARIDRQVRRFLDGLDGNMHVYPSGLIYHNVRPQFNLQKYGRLTFENIKRRRVPMWILERFRPETREDQLKKAIGYHSFNLYALALLKQIYPEHSFWRSTTFEKALVHSNSDRFKQELETNPYGYPYNCTGIEMAVVAHVFNNDTETAREWLTEQFNRSLDADTMLLTKSTEDAATMNARIYEATRLPNISNVC